MSSKLTTELEKQYHRINALAEIELIEQPSDFQATLARIVEVTEMLLPSSGGASIILWDQDDEEFFISASTVPNQSPQTAAERVRSNGTTRWIVENRQPVIVADVSTDDSQLNPMMEENGFKAYVGVPLISAGEIQGVLYALDTEPRNYTKEDIDFLTVLAGRAASTVLNVRLFARMQHMATTDHLTGVYNRHYIYQMAAHELNRSRQAGYPLAALFIDIDRFKSVNDTYGHLVGDQVLKGVARHLRRNVSEVDLIGRYGGEEFVIMLLETDLPAAMWAAESIRNFIETIPVETDAGPISLTVSVGVAEFNECTPTIHTLFDFADDAMYAAKKSGGNAVHLARCKNDHHEDVKETHEQVTEVVT
ncbi:MAG: sensor domain-containing diguanylate cyclase [Chloroflexota bacterium]